MASLEQGRRLYSAKRYPEATTALEAVVKACSCRIPVRQSPCLCKDFLDGLGNGRLRDMLKKRCICSAKSDRRCEKSAHFQALDALAAVAEKVEDVERGLLIAQQMVEILPRDPKAYLRLGKVLRLKGRADWALAAYQQGHELVAKKDPKHEMLPKLEEQRLKVKRLIRTDPLLKLPFELVCIIFQDTDFRTICRCLRISKTWKLLLTCREAGTLWSSQEFSSAHRTMKAPLSPATLMRYAAFANKQVSSVCIHDCRLFDMNSHKLSLILQKPLKHLKLRGSLNIMGWDVRAQNLPAMSSCPSLRSLYIGPDVHIPADLIDRLLRSSPDLEQLSLMNVKDAEELQYRTLPPLDKLKTVEIADRPDRRRIHPNIELSEAEQAEQDETKRIARVPWPNSERLWVENLAHPERHWPGLSSTVRHLCVRNSIAQNSTSRLSLAPSIEEAFLKNVPILPIAPQIPGMEDNPQSMLPEPQTHKFRCFWYHGRQDENESFYEYFLKNSFAAETIEKLFLSPFPFHLLKQQAKLTWLRGSSLKFLGLTGLNVATTFGTGHSDDMLAELVERFPNLEVLDIDKEVVQSSTLGRIIEKTNVKTIYHRSGLVFEDLQIWAASKHGAHVIDASSPSPFQHPDSPINVSKQKRGVKRTRERIEINRSHGPAF